MTSTMRQIYLNEILKRKFKLFNTVIAIIFISSIIYLNKSIELGTSLKFLKSTDNSCEPILRDTNQFYTFIDGVKYPQIIPSFFNSSINFDCLNKNSRTKLILLWNEYGPWKDYKYGLGKIKPFQDRKCPVYNCELTKDRTRLNESDLVLVHMRGDLKVLPQQRPYKSRMVFLITESPIHTKQFDNYEGVFNLTATYNSKSDFSPFYYSNIGFKWELNGDFDENKNYLESKTKLGAILVSNCDAHSKRIEYVREMQKYAPIDILGGCGSSCNITGENRFLSKQCRENISKDYKFFIAFENSVCDDYITEKFFDTLLFDIVPVVLGGGPYDKWIPKSAYINALDFKSPKHLSEYLLQVSNNSTVYNSFFKWKKFITKTNNEYKSICDMCIKLQLESHFGIQEAVFRNVDDFWGYKKRCREPVIDNGVFNYVTINHTVKCLYC